ncbi:MAG: bifunctional diaminohydroxyphosphoribosylaminopyrimidine deaminase/5-amino-6-(5-phosphoribosylamino)uracil reductase RibD [Clostridium sp.]|nr:bifunctional diaminohydroxyphosphoribosylaminopyrimidine deaminase/5-amino-6-(5-phosphoribosylamino)uracil reductase RibD [Clostridium sp.]
MKNYNLYMKKAITLAKKGEGKVSPNPLVGAIVLDSKNKIIGKGWHKKYGEAHAEVNAIKNAIKNGYDCKGATIVVTLEPCSHFGKTPPCADLIIEKGFKKVIIGCTDPNPIVAGNGIKKLKRAGIEVITGTLEEDCRQLNEIFFKNQLKKMPFIAIKTATTMDGKIATKTGSSKWITSEKARKDVQKLRNKYDAILTGSGTIIADNPSLTCRMKNGKNPIRIIIDSQLKTSPKANVYKNDKTKVYIAIKETTKIKSFPLNVEFIKCKTINEKIDLTDLVLKLYEKGIRSILIEAGGKLNGEFIKKHLADKIYQYIAPKITGDNESKTFLSGFDTKDINKSIELSLKSTKMLIPDLRLESYIQYI